MNKKGSVFLGLALGIFIFIMGILILPFILDDITISRVSLSCSDTSISSGNKLTCLFISAVTPYFIWLIVSLALGLVIGGAKS